MSYGQYQHHQHNQQPDHKYIAAWQLRLCDLIYTTSGIKPVQQLTQWDNGTITITWQGGGTTVNPNDPIKVKNNL